MTTQYCESLTQYKRFKTREVTIGDVALGGNNPIRVQSMTTTDTMDIKATVAQSIRMIESGCELVRITAPSKKEAEQLFHIKKQLRDAGYNTPLVADIHFTPNAAEIAARIVEKVRVNPGNYVDKKKFETLHYTDEAYHQELERIHDRFAPLVKICKQEGTAMRIGTNHGSLSDRILSRYGDTPHGMVESALEFIRICETYNYHNLVISMKASNTQVMVQAYRLLVHEMMKNNQNYPLHLGVTEAGDGEDGRIKSAVGIGALLEDGLGDTIRVSLTEEPEAEIPVAQKLISRYSNRHSHAPIKDTSFHTTPFAYAKVATSSVASIGSEHVPIVIADVSNADINDYDTFSQIGYRYQATLDKYSIADHAADFAFFGDHISTRALPGGLQQVYNYSTWLSLVEQKKAFPLFTLEEFETSNYQSSTLNFVYCLAEHIDRFIQLSSTIDVPTVLVLGTKNTHAMAQLRQALFALQTHNNKTPIVLTRQYDTSDIEQFTIDSSCDLGPLFIDGMGNGLWISGKYRLDQVNSVSFGILQATRTRISKTEYISCPSCGRTLFDLQETTAMIRQKTNHLKGLKIGIMGCIVNGPGEMADADYGYVGSGIGKITLYRGQDVVKRQIDSASALDELINLIKSDGNWVEPTESNP